MIQLIKIGYGVDSNSGHPHRPCGGRILSLRQFRKRPASLRGVFCGRAGHNPGVTRRRGLIASGIATMLLLIAMSPSDGRMKDTGGPGIVPFEVAGSQDHADEIMAEWGDKGQDAARESL